MKLLFDTNVLLDAALHREPYFKTSSLAIRYCEDESVIGIVGTNSLTDFFYIMHHAVHNKDIAYEALEALIEIFRPASPDPEDINTALKIRHRDFEDCLLALIAEREQCDYIVTRNGKDFKDFSVKAISPSDFVKMSL